jgi:uncharacterized protein
MSSLDPRSALVIDTRELGRRAGSMKEYKFSVAAPADLGLAMIAVPTGSDIELDFRLEAVMDGVLVTGTALVSVEGECSRCLEPIAFDLEVDLQELFEYPSTDSKGRQEANPEIEDELPTLDGDFLDLEPVLRDAVVLAFPLSPLCQPDCLGLCAQCGVNLNDDPEHAHETIDPRWAALAELSKDNEAK